MERLTIPDEHMDGGIRKTLIDAREVRKHAMTIYWQLKKYEDTGITPDQLRVIEEEYTKMSKELAELRQQNSENPYKVGDTVYCIEKYEDGYDYSGYRYLGEFELYERYVAVCSTYTWCDDFNEQLREMAIENTDDARGDIYLFNSMNVYRTKEEAKAAADKLEEE